MSALDRAEFYVHGERRLTNGHSKDRRGMYLSDIGQPELISIMPKGSLRDFRPDRLGVTGLLSFRPVATPKIEPIKDPVKEIARLTNTKQETAKEIFQGIENEIDQICKEEKVEFFDPEEKAKLVLGAINALTNLAKKISKQAK